MEMRKRLEAVSDKEENNRIEKNSIKKNGIYDESVEIARKHHADLILAVGGSVCDDARLFLFRTINI